MSNLKCQIIKKIKLLLCLIMAAGLSHAQETDYDLNSYKTGDYRRKSLDFSIGSNGSFKNDMWNGKNQSFSSDLGVAYNQTKNSRKLYESLNVSLRGGLDYSKEDGYDYVYGYGYGGYYPYTVPKTDKINKSNYNFNFNRIGYHYLNAGNTFIEFSPSGYISQEKEINKHTFSTVYSDYASYSKHDYRDENGRTDASARLNIGIGKGRIEFVEDARQAVYILDELKEKGILTRDLTTEEINELAAVITGVKNKRLLDSRLRLIEEIETIDSFLVEKGYINKSNSTAYFTSLYDNWLYAGTPERLAGSRFTVGLTPIYTFNKKTYDRKVFEGEDYNLNSKSINTLFQGDLYLRYEYEKPVKLKFQNSVGAYLNSSWGKWRDEHSFVQSNLTGSYKWGYYPNSRTYVSIGISQGLNWIRYEKENNRLYSYTTLSSDAYYYLSPQLRIFGECNISYAFHRNMNDNINSNDKHPNTAFSLGLKYSLF